ncbi:hypothetical protein BN871_KS_00030 [Paenibacillus sp. P22]|nr:hypothetical protein BN871_KS_00030 [Paenibacillus sp. P22]
MVLDTIGDMQLTPTKLKKNLGWVPKHDYESGISSTIKWYINNEDWMREVLNGSYKSYFDTQYGERIVKVEKNDE